MTTIITNKEKMDLFDKEYGYLKEVDLHEYRLLRHKPVDSLQKKGYNIHSIGNNLFRIDK